MIYCTTESHDSVVNIYQPVGRVGKLFIAPLSYMRDQVFLLAINMFVKCFIGINIYACFRSFFSVFYSIIIFP